MLEILISLIIIFAYSIKCMDIKLSLGSKLNENNTYPVIITLKEPLISQINNIDLFCVYDTSGSMIGNRTFYLKKALNLIIDTLNKNDRLSLIPFSTYSKTELVLTEMNKSNKKTAKEIVNNIRASGATNFNAAIDEFFKGIQNYTKLNDGRIKSIIFFTDGEPTSAEKNSTKYLYNLLKTTNQKYDFTINTIGIGSYIASYLLMDFSDKRDGAFYSVNETNYYMMEYYVLNIIGAMRTTSFNFVNMKIESNYEIVKIFGNNHLFNYSLIDSKIINNEVLQFISGKEYTYVIEVKLPDKIERGEKILNFNVVYTDVFGKIYQASNSLTFDPSIINPNLYREEYCRVWALELIENSIIISQSLKEVVSEIKKECGNDLNKNISLILDEILLYDKNIRYYNSFIYGVISEGILKRNGINLWYSNEYQYKLINDYIYGLIYELLINSKNN